MPKTPQVIDLGDQFPDSSTDVGEYVVLKGLWGQDFRILQGVNLFSALHVDADPGELSKMLVNAIHPDDQKAFHTAISAQRNLSDGEQLGKIVNLIVGAASGNPPTSSGASSGGTTKRVAR